MNQFIIPANSKKSQLILGLFNTFDIILFISGIGITLLLLLILPLESIVNTVIALLPAAICGFLVLPIPNYHNILTFLMGAITFYTNRQKFIWKGWCFVDEINKYKK